MSYLTELQAEKVAILKANSDLHSALFEWIGKSGVTEEDAELAKDYINDMISDTIGTRLRNITNEIAELEAEDGPNPAKLHKEELV
jgi:hypothetical protein